jgi:hypothetical protein
MLALLPAIRAGAAISEGPVCTNAVAAKIRHDTQFYEAEQSYQEKLKVGRERYEQKQAVRAKVIAAMAGQLQARQQMVIIHPRSEPDRNTDETILHFGHSLALTAMVVGVIFFAIYLKRLNLNFSAARLRPKMASAAGGRSFRKKYRVVALKPVTIWANVEVSKVERTPLGKKVRRTKLEPAWVELKAGEIRDQLGLVLGIHPDYVPQGRRISVADSDSDIVPLGAWSDGELPKNFFEFFRMDVSG